MRCLLAVLVLVVAGACFSPSFDDGEIPCGAAGECPSDLRCTDGRCYRLGHEPQACQAGYQRQGTTCVDIDECSAGTDDCAEAATCTNSAGSFSCACPATGYSGDGRTCSDIDECATGAASCADDATCVNSAGSYSCTCDAGYAGSGTICWPDYVSFGVGSDHGCGVRADGALLCWGSNASGQLGLPADTLEQHTPVRVGSELWSRVSVGVRASCGIRRDDTLWCWGENACGVVGNGATPDLHCDGLRPVHMMFPTGGSAGRWKTVSVGRTHACAVALDGALWCWGQNHAGELGTSDENNHLVPTRVGNDVAGDRNWDDVRAGGQHTCGVRAGGQLWCWGSNARGQLGDSLAAPRASFPKRVGTATTWTDVAAGEEHTCGVLGDGRLYCWGASDRGQLGVGKSGDGVQENAPVAVTVLGDGWASVGAGARMTCGRAASGRLLCWGENTYGELADGTFGDRDRPATVGRDDDWDTLAVGQRTACARKEGGQLHCWGRNLSGALGVGTGGDATTPRETGSGGFAELAHGGSHACGIKTAGRTLWCWGYNFNGQLGIGVVGGARDEPTQVAGGGAWAQVVAGDSATCGIKMNGELFCWGANFFGQLGIDLAGADGQRPAPTRVSDGGATWTAISHRASHTCGIQTGGALYCWGSSTLGRLGVGTVAGNVTTPRRVGTDSWTHVATGSFHSCGLRAGQLHCWGYDGDGQVGIGAQPPDNVPQLSPVRVGTASDWTAITAGGFHSCGLRGAGNQLSCWGYNFYGQVGNGSSGANADQRTPASIAFGEHWVDVHAGDYTTCGVNGDGNLFCWGANGGGLVGNGMVGEVVVTPVMIDASRTFSSVGLMNQAACALHVDGSTACWGSNTLGEFGDDTAFYGTPTPVAD